MAVSEWYKTQSMFKLHFKSILSFLLFGMAAVACQDNETVYADLDGLSDEARKFFGIQGSMQRSAAGTGNSGASMINRSFGAAKDASPSLSLAGVTSSDSTLVPVDPYPWVSCATITQTANSDGSTTYITDYGDGCMEGYGDYKYFMHGKLTSRYKNEQTQKGSLFSFSYFSRTKMENYGGSYYYNGDTSTWMNDGRSTYSGNSEYDTAKQTFAGNYSWSDTSKYSYAKETYSSNSYGSVVYNEKKSVTASSHYEYTTSSGFYSTTVIRPLVMDYSCLAPLAANGLTMRCVLPSVYISGRERIEYNRDGVAGSFEIDYGNGECDTIVYIYENGKVYKVDLFADYDRIMIGSADGSKGG